MTKLQITVEARDDDAAVRLLQILTMELADAVTVYDECITDVRGGRAECKVERGEG
jgi:hypothetical protein